jgi:uncharacterized membrane protein
MPVSPVRLLVLAAAMGVLLVMIQVNLLVIAFDKLGLSPESGLMLLFGALSGSAVNLPLARIRAAAPDQRVPSIRPLSFRVRPYTGTTLVAVNVGGCIIPVLFSLYLVSQGSLPAHDILFAIAVVSLFAYLFSRPVQGLGIVMPVLVAPLIAAITAILIDVHHSAPLAYIGGTLGVLIGADLLRLRSVSEMGTPLVSIGGAGTFDGIFLTGIVAALLA